MTDPTAPEPDPGPTDAALPEPSPEPAAQPAESPVETPAEVAGVDVWVWGRWRYSGPPGRIYTIVPVTPEPGDVVETWGPIDACWTPTDDAPTRRPDNWRPDLPATPGAGPADDA